MLDPAWEARGRKRAGGTSPAAVVERFGYGGVELEIRRDPELGAAEPGGFALRPGLGPTVGTVACTARRDRTLRAAAHDPPNALVCARSGDRLRLESEGMRAELTAHGEGRYVAEARCADGPAAVAALVRALAATVLRLEGGATLHAAAVEHAGRAIAYLGPSGAGKSTAVRLTDGARCLAEDHVALVPALGGWHVWRLPGGTASGAPPARAIVLPLAALLRVRHERHTPRIGPLLGADALFAVREAVESDDCSVDAEAARLSIAERIAREVRVATIHTVPGRPIGDLLARWLDVDRPRAAQRSGAA